MNFEGWGWISAAMAGILARTPTIKSVSARGIRWGIEGIPDFNNWAPIYIGR